MRPRWGQGISTVIFMGLFNGEIHGAVCRGRVWSRVAWLAAVRTCRRARVAVGELVLSLSETANFVFV